MSGIEHGQVVVRHEGLEIRCHPPDCRAPEGEALAIGTRVSLRFPSELLSTSPGFYTALSDSVRPEGESEGTLRVYFHLRSSGAVQLTRKVTTLLNGAGLFFRLKVLNNPDNYDRCDAGVLYFRESDLEPVSRVLQGIYPEVAAELKQGTPVFTKRLAPGIGMAADPGSGVSFGLHRCGLLAEGLLRAHDQGHASVEDRLEVIAARFAEDGISLEAPYLRPGSRSQAGFGFLISHSVERSPDGLTETPVRAERATYLLVAREIGQHLSRLALWDGARCNWLGALPRNQDGMDADPERTITALGPELYSGTSGIAVFLAELHAVTGQAEARRTALGAARQALSRIDAVPFDSRLGLYSGWIGIGFAALQVGTILGNEALLADGRDVVERSAREIRNDEAFDLVSGSAGAIVALLAIRGAIDGFDTLEVAERWGERLLRAAERSDIGWSWATAGQDHQHLRNLTGLSHGAAGIAYALVSLYEVTGDVRYRTAAELAFRYERSWFDAAESNWPDFRLEADSTHRGRTVTFSTTWCHGAPGIALSRLRAYQVLGDEELRAEAVTALETTRRVTETWLRSETANYSLCHGLSGNAEVLACGGQVLGVGDCDESLAFRVANAGASKFAGRCERWPCGTGGRGSPGLMLGLAGIGRFYLRLSEPAIPSLLMLGHEHQPNDRFRPAEGPSTERPKGQRDE